MWNTPSMQDMEANPLHVMYTLNNKSVVQLVDLQMAEDGVI